MRFQIGEFLHRALFHARVVGEAERQEFVGLVVVLGITHDGLLGHADDVAGGDEGAICEGEILQDFSLDGNFIFHGSELGGIECNRGFEMKRTRIQGIVTGGFAQETL